MIVFIVEWRKVGDIIEGEVKIKEMEEIFMKLGELINVLEIKKEKDRRKDIKKCELIKWDENIENMDKSMDLDRKEGRRRIGNEKKRKEKENIVVDLGECEKSRKRIEDCSIMIDGNGGRKEVNMVEIRFMNNLEKMERIGWKDLEIEEMELGIDSIERKRGFERERKKSNKDKIVERKIEIEIFKIVIEWEKYGNEFMIDN